jgi:hypothetical protein
MIICILRILPDENQQIVTPSQYGNAHKIGALLKQVKKSNLEDL